MDGVRPERNGFVSSRSHQTSFVLETRAFVSSTNQKMISREHRRASNLNNVCRTVFFKIAPRETLCCTQNLEFLLEGEHYGSPLRKLWECKSDFEIVKKIAFVWKTRVITARRMRRQRPNRAFSREHRPRRNFSSIKKHRPRRCSLNIGFQKSSRSTCMLTSSIILEPYRFCGKPRSILDVAGSGQRLVTTLLRV
jgi:hypothetical protein